MDYSDSYFTARSAAGQNATFGRDGYVRIEGESSDYSLSMTFDDDHPTDWFTVQVVGSGEWASLSKAEGGFILEADDLSRFTVMANNTEVSPSAEFSTTYTKAFIYEVSPETIGIRLDTDDNGTFETEIGDETPKNKCSRATWTATAISTPLTVP